MYKLTNGSSSSTRSNRASIDCSDNSGKELKNFGMNPAAKRFSPLEPLAAASMPSNADVNCTQLKSPGF